MTVGVRDGKDADGIHDPDMADDATIVVTITVTDVNEPPTITSGSTSESVSENTATSTVIETYEASDPDASATLTWSLSGDDAGDFVITKNASGQGELKFMNVPNYESPADNGTDNSYNVTVGVRDGLDANGTADTAVDAMRAVTITVTDLDEPGTVTLPATFTTGTAVTPMLTDLDGTPTSVTWQWARAATANGTFANISTGGNAPTRRWPRTWVTTCRPRRPTRILRARRSTRPPAPSPRTRWPALTPRRHSAAPRPPVPCLRTAHVRGDLRDCGGGQRP